MSPRLKNLEDGFPRDEINVPRIKCDRIHDLFSTATTSKAFVTLVKKYMLTIENSYKVKE